MQGRAAADLCFTDGRDFVHIDIRNVIIFQNTLDSSGHAIAFRPLVNHGNVRDVDVAVIVFSDVDFAVEFVRNDGFFVRSGSYADGCDMQNDEFLGLDFEREDEVFVSPDFGLVLDASEAPSAVFAFTREFVECLFQCLPLCAHFPLGLWRPFFAVDGIALVEENHIDLRDFFVRLFEAQLFDVRAQNFALGVGCVECAVGECGVFEFCAETLDEVFGGIVPEVFVLQEVYAEDAVEFIG